MKKTKKKANKEIVVGVAELPPLTLDFKGVFSGFEIDFWDQISKDCKLRFRYRKVAFKDVFRQLRKGEIDVALGGITRNREREQLFDFSYFTLEAGLLIMVNDKNKPGFFKMVGNFLRHGYKKLLEAIIAIVLFIFACGNLLWLVEKGNAFSQNYLPGIFESLWWTIITISTVGYGDYIPQTWLGKSMASVVVVIGYLFFGFFIAEVTSLVTVGRIKSDIESHGDLAGKTVAAMKGTTSIKTLRKIGAKVIPVQKIENAYGKLREEEVDAVVYDAPALMYYARSDSSRGFLIKGDIFDPQTYAFLFRSKDPLREKVNQSILGLRDSGYYDWLYRKWFGDNTKME
ncbi:MAG: transporter substrate-binding domain-containing protein [Parcubacteria group bacterium]|jgi:polar amino acid transport system substrate-binding protein